MTASKRVRTEGPTSNRNAASVNREASLLWGTSEKMKFLWRASFGSSGRGDAQRNSDGVSRLEFRLAVQFEIDGDGGCDIYRQPTDPIRSVAALEDGRGSCAAKDGVSFDHVDSS